MWMLGKEYKIKNRNIDAHSYHDTVFWSVNFISPLQVVCESCKEGECFVPDFQEFKFKKKQSGNWPALCIQFSLCIPSGIYEVTEALLSHIGKLASDAQINIMIQKEVRH